MRFAIIRQALERYLEELSILFVRFERVIVVTHGDMDAFNSPCEILKPELPKGEVPLAFQFSL